ncbi:MAG: response regulator [Candidatus Cyclobacteriaceae bacterium M3_2C_046]
MPKPILICEDDDDIGGFLKMYLNLKNQPFTLVKYGREVVPELKKKKYGLLLLDLGLPDINGVEAAKQIKQEKIQTPVIYFSASSRLKKAMQEVPVEGILAKPFEMEALQQLIDKHANHDD